MLPIFLALAFIIILLIIFIIGQPDEFSVSRRTTIAAPPAQVYPLVNELRKWESWNPWGKLDPNCKMTYDGPPAGTGASYAWDGNNKVGAGRNTITESIPNQSVSLRLDFTRPMTATNMAEFTLQPDGSQTLVIWTMWGNNSFCGKLFGLLMNCEKMCGSQFEKGLAQMKSVAETRN
jgi:uncharacterized protein YndB with AHSA1/START domain